MELELKKTCLNHYDTEVELTWMQEESVETIVPDYCPDIARIVTANGTVCLRSKEMREGKALLSGTVRLTVLYIPENETGLRTLELNIPFSGESEKTGFDQCEILLADTGIEFLETRILNPRKIFSHCKLIHKATGYCRKQLCVCEDAIAPEEYRLEKKSERQKIVLLDAISEKDFSFADSVQIAGVGSGVAEILYSQVEPAVTDSKLISGKILFKGIFYLQIIYRSTDGKYARAISELPFSQIMETESDGENSEVSLSLRMTGAEVQIDGGEDDRQISVTFHMHAVASLRKTQDLSLLCDLYSTTWETEFDAAPLSVVSAHNRLIQRQAVREVVEMGGTAETLLALWVQCGPASCRSEESAVLHTSVLIRALALDDHGAPFLAERRIDVNGQSEHINGIYTNVFADCPETPQGVLTDHGVEVRFTVYFQSEIETQNIRAGISAVRLTESAPRDISGVPSLILRCLGERESVWDLAKRYYSTIPDLLAANCLETEEDIPGDRLLLIPRKRG